MWTTFSKQLVVTGPVGAVGMRSGRLGSRPKTSHPICEVYITKRRLMSSVCPDAPHAHADTDLSISAHKPPDLKRRQMEKKCMLGPFLIRPGFTTKQKLEQHICQSDTSAVEG